MGDFLPRLSIFTNIYPYGRRDAGEDAMVGGEVMVLVAGVCIKGLVVGHGSVEQGIYSGCSS